ncbi:TetR/AcrR family transcriptional regulator, partial [Actinoalloteichus caeruleus]
MTAAASTPKGERRRQLLVAAAAELLGEGGFDAIRHRAVAERADLPLASTTYYFDSLDDLIAAAVEHRGRLELSEGRRRLDELAGGGHDRSELVELLLDLLLGTPAGDRELESILVRYERFVTTPRRPYLAPLMRAMSAELEDLIAETLRLAGAPSDRDRVRHLIALVDGRVVNALIESEPDPRAQARQPL